MSSRDHEIDFAATVAFALGARAHRRDFNQGGRIRDFDLVFSDRPDEPLELTIFAREAVMRTGRRLVGRDTAVPTLTRTWMVSVPNEVDGAPYDARRLYAEAPALLAELEHADIDSFDTVFWFRQPDPAIKETLLALARLRCEHGRASAPGEAGPRLYVGWGGGGRSDPELVTKAVEVEASKLDNIEKLRALPDATRRHLFVYIHFSEALAFNAVRHGPPWPIPVLPEPITTAWVSGEGNLLYSVTPPGGWEDHEIPDEVFEQPERWAS